MKLIQAYKHFLYLHSRIDMWLWYEIKVYVKKTTRIIVPSVLQSKYHLYSFMHSEYFNTPL
jgi:hypothetical protein